MKLGQRIKDSWVVKMLYALNCVDELVAKNGVISKREYMIFAKEVVRISETEDNDGESLLISLPAWTDIQERLTIKFAVNSYISYANYRNQAAVKPIYFEIQNISKSVIDDLSFSISSNNGLIEPYVSDPFSIEPENVISPKTLAFKFDEKYLLSLAESERCRIDFKVHYQGS